MGLSNLIQPPFNRIWYQALSCLVGEAAEARSTQRHSRESGNPPLHALGVSIGKGSTGFGIDGNCPKSTARCFRDAIRVYVW